MNECPCYKEGKCVSGCPCPSIQPESRYCSSNIDFLMVSPGNVQNHINEAVWSTTYMLNWHRNYERQRIMRPAPEFRGNQQKMCTFILKGQFYMLGGDHTEYQAFRLSGCSWQRLPELEFKLDSARCTSIELQQRALLCSSVPRPKDCYLFDGYR